MANGKSSAVKDAAIAAVAVVAVVALVSILIKYGVYWAAGLVLVGVVVFAGVLYFHSSRFYRRMAGACLALLAGVLSIPTIKFSGVLGQIAAFDFVMDSIGTWGVLGISMTFCVALCVCAWMDRTQQQPGRTVDVSPGDANLSVAVQSQVSGQQICSPDKSPTIGYAEAVHITYAASAEMPVSAEQGTPPAKNKPTCTWPGVSLPYGGPKISEPFAGREDELKELAAAMAGDKKIAAVIGMAGQGKSCLIGEWYKRGARPPEGIGLFWRKVYESGYTFDRFLDDLHLYLAGEPIDRMQIKTARERAIVVEGLLATKPCWIILDGVERWLKRWATDPDADASNPSPDDRGGWESEFNKFLTGACSRENGSRLLLTTRAIPSALDENLPVMIGDKHGPEKRLADLKPEEALRLLDELDVKGGDNAKREAVTAYGCHAYAVHVLGVLIRDLYGGDATQWRKVNPLGEPTVGGLFERIIETSKEDLPLLEFVACSLGSAPVEMLAELMTRDEIAVRKSLAGLKKWQMVEFDGSEAEQHTIVRQFLVARTGEDNANTRRKEIAVWWARRKMPVNPTRIDEVRPLLRAIEHLVLAKDVSMAISVFLMKPSPESHYNTDAWLGMFGYLDEDVRINGLLIDAYMDSVSSEVHCGLRDGLAKCCGNRGVALRAQGHLSEAIADYGRAIEIMEDLVEREGRHELRNDLASYYNNRANALRDQGHLSEAIVDYGQAIEIRKDLVEGERRRELRNDLAICYNNRGTVLADQGYLREAIADYERAIEITEGLVEAEGRREFRSDLARCYNNRGVAFRAQGHLSETVADCGRAIEITEGLVEGEGRCELRNDLARYHNNRGTALADQGRLLEAIADYARAIGIEKGLVEGEGRRELRNDLARYHNNRGVALADQGHLVDAIADYTRAIAITEGLVEGEGRRELCNDLAGCYNNRGFALAAQGYLSEAIGDYARAITIYEGLVEGEGRRELRGELGEWLHNRAVARRQMGELLQARTDNERSEALLRAVVVEGQRHMFRLLLRTLGFRCRYAEEFGDHAKAVQGANEAMQWFLEEVERKRATEPLLKAAAEFTEHVRGNQELLLKHGLDESLWRRFQASLDPKA